MPVRALVIAPVSAQAAYLAMVEENEIRVNLSFYERARITQHTVRERVYPTPQTVSQGLYAATTRSERSKIGSFMTVIDAFDPVLKFPTAISENLGLALAREISPDPAFAVGGIQQLKANQPDGAAQELRILSGAVVAVSQPVAPHPGTSPSRPSSAVDSASDSDPGSLAPGCRGNPL